MLSGTLLNDTQLRATSAAGAGLNDPGVDEALASVFPTIRRHAERRSSNALAAEAGHREEFDGLVASVVRAMNGIRAMRAREIAAMVPQLFEPDGPGVEALREYWLKAGFSKADVDPYLDDAVNARGELHRVIDLMLREDDWPEAIKTFSAGNPSSLHWGFGYGEQSDLHPLTQSFVSTSRSIGVTPSVFLLISIVLLAHKAGKEISARQ